MRTDPHSTLDELTEVVAAQALDIDDPPPRDYAKLCAAQLHALACVEIAQHLENLATILATGLGNGAPIVEALNRLRVLKAE